MCLSEKLTLDRKEGKGLEVREGPRRVPPRDDKFEETGGSSSPSLPPSYGSPSLGTQGPLTPPLLRRQGKKRNLDSRDPNTPQWGRPHSVKDRVTFYHIL